MRFVRVLTAVALSVSASSASVGVSSAQDAGLGCSCVTAGSNEGVIGQVVSANGEVLATGASNFDAAAAGTPLSVGSEVAVGGRSAARISVGTCLLDLKANTVTRISPLENGNLCVGPVQAAGLPAAPGAAAGVPAWAPVALFGAVAVGAVALGVSKNSKNGTDPISQ